MKDKENALRKSIKKIQLDLFHLNHSTTVSDYIDPRILLRFMDEFNLRYEECYFSNEIQLDHQWALEWIGNGSRSNEIIDYLN